MTMTIQLDEDETRRLRVLMRKTGLSHGGVIHAALAAYAEIYDDRMTAYEREAPDRRETPGEVGPTD